jgi:hypothetical protein
MAKDKQSVLFVRGDLKERAIHFMDWQMDMLSEVVDLGERGSYRVATFPNSSDDNGNLRVTLMDERGTPLEHMDIGPDAPNALQRCGVAHFKTFGLLVSLYRL